MVLSVDRYPTDQCFFRGVAGGTAWCSSHYPSIRNADDTGLANASTQNASSTTVRRRNPATALDVSPLDTVGVHRIHKDEDARQSISRGAMHARQERLASHLSSTLSLLTVEEYDLFHVYKWRLPGGVPGLPPFAGSVHTVSRCRSLGFRSVITTAVFVYLGTKLSV